MIPPGQNPYYLQSLYANSQSNALTLDEQYKRNPNQNLILQQHPALQGSSTSSLTSSSSSSTSTSSGVNASSTTSPTAPSPSSSSAPSSSSMTANALHPMLAAQYAMGYPPQYPSMMTPSQHPMFSMNPSYYQTQASHPFQSQPLPGYPNPTANPYIQAMMMQGNHGPLAGQTSGASTGQSSISSATPSQSQSQSQTHLPSEPALLSSSSSSPASSSSSAPQTSTSTPTTPSPLTHVVAQHIKHPNAVEVQPTSATQGALYPIKRRIHKRVICFDSRFRDNYLETSSSDFIYTLPYPIKNVISMRLNSLELPNSWYSYSAAKKTNTFQIIDASNVSRYITYPDGNYQAMDFETASRTIINDAFGNGQFELSVSLTSGRTVIRDLSGQPFQLKFNTGDVNSDIRKNLGWYMGYRKASYSGESSYESEGIYNAGGNDYIYLVLNDFNHSEAPSVVAMLDNTILDDNILAKIPISNDKFQILFDNPGTGVTKQREYMGSVTLSRIHIKILNEFGDRIDFNKMDYSFSLELEIAFE
jgi:hypothetical protein